MGRHRDLDTTLFCQELFLRSDQQVSIDNLGLYMQVITDHVRPEKGANLQFQLAKKSNSKQGWVFTNHTVQSSLLYRPFACWLGGTMEPKINLTFSSVFEWL